MRAESGDFFGRARNWAATILFLAGVLAIGGSFLDWVTIEPVEPVVPGGDVQGDQLSPTRSSDPFTGVEAGDGWFVVGAGAVLILAAALLVLGRRTGWLAFLATLPLGAIAVADYRAVGEPTSGLADRMELVGEVTPALGLILVLAGAIGGLIGSVVAIAASPKSVPED